MLPQLKRAIADTKRYSSSDWWKSQSCRNDFQRISPLHVQLQHMRKHTIVAATIEP
jgi:hypothetical protein